MSRAGGKGYVIVATVYLLGLFIGALDTGIVTPARTVIQADLQVADQLGVWMITIYTLAYAAAIPVMGKLADRLGRKYVYLGSVLLFGIGSLLCGLSQDMGSFTLLLVARAVQAIGGGGIMPVATAEFGTAFPREKRGMALGLVGGVYGVANVFGASAGSLILDLFGQGNWQFIFYVNVPICLFILVVGLLVLPNTKERESRPVDGLGICVLICMTLSLLYGLKNIDFFSFGTSVTSTDVYPFLLGFLVAIPLFIVVERHASDPVINLSYFSNKSIVVTLGLSIITGVIMMGTIFVPQFAENVMKMPSGSGGYFVIILAVFAGVGSPVSGKLIDRFGVKVVLGFGLGAAVAGSLFLAFVATVFANVFTLVISLILIGLGMGFTMGTPLNYMMLAQTEESEANSALATLSLVRSIGTAVTPAIMVAFIAHAGVSMQDRIMDVLPEMGEIALGQSGAMSSGNGTNVSSETFEMNDDMLKLMQASDVTTIVENTKTMAKSAIDQMVGQTGMPQTSIDALEKSYIEKIDEQSALIEKTYQSTLNEGFRGAFTLVAITSFAGVILLLLYREKPLEIEPKVVKRG